MQKINQVQELLEQNDEIDLKKLLQHLLSKWHWFVLLATFGALSGFLVGKFSQPVYSSYSTILVKDDSKGIGVDDLFDSPQLGTESNIQNHIGIITSFILNFETLQNLNWHISWFEKGFFSNKDLYLNSPFKIDYSKNQNVCGIPLNIIPVDEDTYEIRVNDKTTINGIVEKIKFLEVVKYGENFQNDFFSFSIEKATKNVSGEYILVFNDLEDKALEYLNKLDVSIVGNNSELIKLQMQGNSPARLVDYLNELSKEYLNTGLEDKNKSSQNTAIFIDKQLVGILDSLKQTGILFAQFQSENKAIDINKESEMIASKMFEIESEESILKFKLQYYKNILTYIQNDDNINKIVLPSTVGIVDVALNAQIVQLCDLYNEKSILVHTAEEKNPKLILLRKKIESTILILSENVKNLLENAEIKYENLKARKSEMEMKLANLPKREQKLIDIKRKFDLNNELYTFLLKRRSEASIATASNVPDAQILDIARIKTTEKIGPKTPLNTVIGLMLGIFLVFLVMLINDFFNDTIKSKEDLEYETSLPILGQIVKNKYKSDLAILKNGRSRLSESFRELRVNIQQITQNPEPKVLAVHSMIPGEGKTFSSINLGAIIAMNNKQVLVVSCDMRKPKLQDIFNTTNARGLSSFLLGHHDFNEIINKTGIENLSTVDSGPVPSNPVELIENGRFDLFIEQARDKFDFIVLDNAPVALVTDGILVSHYADLNIFVLRQKYSKRNQIKYINQLEEKKSITKIGLVLNDVTYGRFDKMYGRYNDSDGYYTEGYQHVDNRTWKIFKKSS